MPCVHDPDRPPPADEPADLLDRPLGRREADPLDRALGERLQTLDRQCEMGTALRACDCVHLVDDQRLDAAQRFARLRGEHQVERLGRRDEDVRRLLLELAAFLLGGIAGPDTNPQPRLETCEWAAQVALDVVVQCLQRRDVEQAQPCAGRAVQAIDRPEERGQRLPGAGRCLDQDVLAARDRRPALHLRGRRRGEGLLEPGPCRRREHAQRVHPWSLLLTLHPAHRCPTPIS